jgi:hypothetical protein
MGDDEGRVDLAPLHPLEQGLQVAMHVGLAHPEGQALGESRPDGELVGSPP